MVKHSQTIRWQIADELSVFDHFVGLALKGLRVRNFQGITFIRIKTNRKIFKSALVYI